MTAADDHRAIDIDRVRASAASGRDAYLRELAELVAIDSGTLGAEGIGRVGRAIASRLEALGARLELEEDASSGPTVVARFGGRSPGARLLVVGHLDTVFPAGTAASRPLEMRDGRAFGPGAADMKGGLLLLVHALATIEAVAGTAVPAGELVVVLGPDEEAGSPVGSVAIRREATFADAALVLEPARPTGDLIAARKGMLQARLRFTGLAAHAGVEPERGRSAVLAAAHATIALHDLAGRTQDLTCSVGTFNGGTRANVIPDEAVLEFDLRAFSAVAMADAEQAIAAICARPAVDGVTVRLEEIGRFAPMPSTPDSEAMLAVAVGIGSRLGLHIGAVATGGASDANTIASLGVPVLDGLGPVGGAIHTLGEYLEVDSLGDRIAILAGLLVELGRRPHRPPRGS